MTNAEIRLWQLVYNLKLSIEILDQIKKLVKKNGFDNILKTIGWMTTAVGTIGVL